MCELFGFTGQYPREVNEELKEFYSHSERHPNGWGLAVLSSHDTFIEKEPMQASKSHYLRERLREPIRATNVMAHIRYATIGNVERWNCHPFTGKDSTGRRWTLMHNGTIFDFPEMNSYISMQSGETDSERILLYIIDCINNAILKKHRPLSVDERFAVLDDIVVRMSEGNKLNLIIYDGDLFYVHSNTRGKLHQKRVQDGIFFSTEPLSQGVWEPIPFTTLLGYRSGRLIYTGTCHEHEYIEDPENIRLLYLSYAGL